MIVKHGACKGNIKTLFEIQYYFIQILCSNRKMLYGTLFHLNPLWKSSICWQSQVVWIGNQAQGSPLYPATVGWVPFVWVETASNWAHPIAAKWSDDYCHHPPGISSVLLSMQDSTVVCKRKCSPPRDCLRAKGQCCKDCISYMSPEETRVCKFGNKLFWVNVHTSCTVVLPRMTMHFKLWFYFLARNDSERAPHPT